MISFTVAQRAKEISIRMALGARTTGVVRMFLARAVFLAGAGALIGVVAAVAFGRALRSQLFGVTPLDPLTLTAVVVILIASAATAGYLPARRAARLDPASSLRGD